MNRVLATLLATRLASTPERLFLVDGETRLTFAAFGRRVEAVAGGLQRLGIGTGDVVSWQLPSWWEGAVLAVAIDSLGAIGNPILPIYRERELGFIARQARSRALFVPGVFRGFDHRELAATLRATVEHLVVVRDPPPAGMLAWAELAGADPRPPAADAATGDAGLRQRALGAATVRERLAACQRDANRSLTVAAPNARRDVAFLFYTSGTTAEPKGVMHTGDSIAAFARANAAVAGASDADVALLQFPLTHIGGIGAFLALPLLLGSRVVYLDAWDPERALALIEREGVTSAGGPPAILQGLLAAPGFRPERVRSLRLAATGAADIPPELVRAVRRSLAPVSYRSYGLTECPMFTSGTIADDEQSCATTDGRPTPGCEARIVGDDGRALPAGQEGEIEAYGPQLCAGYLDAALDADAFTADGFLRTGDLGVLDAAGRLRVTGRKKDIIIRKGENLSAKAIEDVLHEHPAIAEAAVIGLPDAASGERVCACIVPRQGGCLDLAQIRAFMESRGVMRQKIPEQVEVLEALPRNATGKVLKWELRRRLG